MTDLERRDALILSHIGFVKSIALQLIRRLPTAVDLDDLIACGNLGLVQAAHRYDETRNDSFAGYAADRVRGAMLDSVRRRHWSDLHSQSLDTGGQCKNSPSFLSP